MAKLKEYDCGLRVIVQNIPYVRSVSACIWVGTGSSRESEHNNGISHFIEHVLFKGTEKLSAFDIANKFERLGASVNAFTSKEATCFYFKSIDDDVETCFSTLNELFFHSVFDKKELDNERNVVIEEINMDDDSPEDICYDELAKAAYGNHPMAMPVLGKRENVRRFDKPEILEYIKDQYCGEAIVIAFAGNITQEKVDKLVEKYVLPQINGGAQKNKATAPAFELQTKTFIKDFKQSNLMLGYPSVSISDRRGMAVNALSIVLGGCMGSRMFQSIREKKGLAYSVYSSPSKNRFNGLFNIAFNINVVNTRKVLESAFEEIDKLIKSGITESELDMAKAQLKSSLVFGQESVQSIMLSMGKTLLLGDEVFEIDRKIREIEELKVDDINRLAAETFSRKPAVAYVGPESGIDFDAFIQR